MGIGAISSAHCRGKSGDKRLNVHHLESRQTVGNRPYNLAPLCVTCHDKHQEGRIRLKAKPSREFRAGAFMTSVRWRLIDALRARGYNVRHPYCYNTKSRRIELALPKSHANDVFAIAGGFRQTRTGEFLIKQERKCNRKLGRGD